MQCLNQIKWRIRFNQKLISPRRVFLIFVLTYSVSHISSACMHLIMPQIARYTDFAHASHQKHHPRSNNINNNNNIKCAAMRSNATEVKRVHLLLLHLRLLRLGEEISSCSVLTSIIFTRQSWSATKLDIAKESGGCGDSQSVSQSVPGCLGPGSDGEAKP